MAPRRHPPKAKGSDRKNGPKRNSQRTPLVPRPSSSYLTMRLKQKNTAELLSNASDEVAKSIFDSELHPAGQEFIKNQTQGAAWHDTLLTPAEIIAKDEAMMLAFRSAKLVASPEAANASVKGKERMTKTYDDPADTPQFQPASILIKSTRLHNAQIPKRVRLNTTPIEHRYTPLSPLRSFPPKFDVSSRRKAVLGGALVMADPKRPALKLKLPAMGGSNNASASSPIPSSAIRTPSIKLKLSSKAGSPETPKIKLKTEKSDPSTSSKKRKRPSTFEAEPVAAPAPPSTGIKRKLTLKTSSAKTPITPAPVFKLKAKGKVPKRPLGLGYDSELEDAERDPVILEGFILRMPPGPDCDYVQNAITNGTVGISRLQGGADIRMRFLDTAGRRGLMFVNGNQYATSVVDLPCIIEAMKSWDKKGFVKSLDICQMMLVLGPCSSDEEAKNYPLPPDVDPKTYAYAHGITAPMRYVRKRRFDRTRRAKLDDIESVERKVAQLLEADAKAESVSYQLYDEDPRLKQDVYSPEEYGSDQDAEAEDDDYFGNQGNYSGNILDTPMDHEEEPAEEDIAEFDALFEGGDDNDEPVINGQASASSKPHMPDYVADDSIAVTSASASPGAMTTEAPTPAADADQAQSSDDEESDEDDDGDAKQGQKDLDEVAQQVRGQIADLEHKIREHTEQIKKQTLPLLKKKLAGKIRGLQDDVAMLKKKIGEDDDGDGDDA